MNRVKHACTALIACLLVVMVKPAVAMTAGELLQDDSKTVGNYLSGLVDMLSYMEFVKGDEERGRCINRWYYETQGSVEQVYDYLEKYPDKFAGTIVMVLAKQPCPLTEGE